MAKIIPVPQHVAITMSLDEADAIVLCLDTLRSWAAEDMTEAVVVFAAQLTEAVTALRAAAAAESVDEDTATA